MRVGAWQQVSSHDLWIPNDKVPLSPLGKPLLLFVLDSQHIPGAFRQKSGISAEIMFSDTYLTDLSRETVGNCVLSQGTVGELAFG